MSVIDVAPTIETRDESFNLLAEKIHYPAITLSPKVDTIILQEVASIVGKALSDYSQSGAVTNSPADDIRALIYQSVNETSLDERLAPIILSGGSTYMQDRLIDHANKLFYLALDNATDVAVTAFTTAQHAKANGKYGEYEKQGKTIELFSCELSEWLADEVNVTQPSASSTIGKAAASVVLAASVSAGLLNASPAAAEENPNQSIINNKVAAVQVIGNLTQSPVEISIDQDESHNTETLDQQLTPDPVIDFSTATDVAKGEVNTVKDENATVNLITMQPDNNIKSDLEEPQQLQTRKENNTTAKGIEKQLSSNVVDVITRLRAAAAKKSLNELSMSESDIFSSQDPFNNKSVLSMPLSPELALKIRTKTDVINAILANDTEVIAIFLQYYDDNPPSDEMLEIIKDASVVSFSAEEAKDLTDDQKILMLFILHDLQTELMHEADAQYKARYKAYIAKQKEEQITKNNVQKAGYSAKVVKSEVKKLTRLSKEKQDNVAKLIIAGQNLMTKQGIDKDEIIAVIGQGILESGYLNSALASAPHYNIFGVKAGRSWTGKKVLMPTHEVVNGKRVAVMAYFRSYGSLEEALEDRINSLGNLSFYKDARRCATSPKKYLQGLMYKLDDDCDVTNKKEPRYATADQEDYVNNILSVIKSTNINEIVKKSYAKPPEITKRAKNNRYVKVLSNGLTHMSQNDSLTGHKSYPKTNGEHKTMAQSGCSPTSWADALYSTGVDESATPLSIASLFLKKGGRNSSIDAAKTIEETYNVNVVNISNLSTENQKLKIMRALKINPSTGKPFGAVIASGQDSSIYDEAPFTTSGHVIGIKKIQENGSVMVMDPLSVPKSKRWWSESQVLERANYLYIMYVK